MKKVITSELIPVKIWTDEVEEGAMVQIKNLANLPFAFKHIAIMPDTHQGYGMPIGGVMATKGVVLPNAVGNDIGCGMCAVRTDLTEIGIDDLKKVMGLIRSKVPVGFNYHKEPQDESLLPERNELHEVVCKNLKKALLQIGTLGGGNHFIEVQKGNDGYIWIMVHSGSRNLGKQVCDHYQKAANDLNRRWYSSVPESVELAFLPVDECVGRAYLEEMEYCVKYAFANRKLILERIKESFNEVIGKDCFTDKSVEAAMINISHNYAATEHHFNEDVVVHRKGATSAEEGEIGIIPGSMGAQSFIVRGLGNKDSFCSCSHGAGRKLSRGKAVKQLSLEDEIAKLNSAGIIHGLRSVENLDEAPSAYKDISEVMENQSDLVEVVVTLTPIASIKG